MTEDMFGLGKLSDNGIELIKTIYPDAIQPSAQKIGKALETVFGLGNTILLPVKLLNEKTNLLFKTHMKKYEEKLLKHSEEEIISVSPDIGLPIIDRLTYLTNEEIAELFIDFLVSASLSTSTNQAHPRFITILNSISVDEARIIKYFYEKEIDNIPFIDYQIKVNKIHEPTKYLKPLTETEIIIPVLENITNLQNNIEFMSNENINFYLSNLESLGILIKIERPLLKNEDIYTIINQNSESTIEQIKHNEYPNLKIDYPNHELIVDQIHGTYLLSDLGKIFIRICNNK